MSRYLGHTVATSEELEYLFDADFTENVECFRKDTLELGYEDEMERVIKENTREDGTIDYVAIISIVFSYCLEYKYEIVEVNGLKIISVAYMYQ